MTETNRNQPEATTDRLEATLAQLTTDQIRFVVARSVEFSKDHLAAKAIGVSAATVKSWKTDGAPIDEAVRLMARDGLVTALHIRKRNLAKAMAVKVKGLDSDDEKVRQSVATELIEWELGKATQKQSIDANVHITEVVEEIVTASDLQATSGTEGVSG